MGSGPRFQLSRMKYILVSTAVVPYLVSADFIRIPGRQPIGGQQDENGCYTSAGYSWCEPLNQCIRSWETDCDVPASSPPPPAAGIIGGQQDENGCYTSAGYSWCEP